jgi:hypothetical protein
MRRAALGVDHHLDFMVRAKKIPAKCACADCSRAFKPMFDDGLKTFGAFERLSGGSASSPSIVERVTILSRMD